MGWFRRKEPKEPKDTNEEEPYKWDTTCPHCGSDDLLYMGANYYGIPMLECQQCLKNFLWDDYIPKE